MSTNRQIQANRMNALKSSGPKTEAEKAIVAGNAIKHGILSKEVLLKGESRQNLDELKQTLYGELNHVTLFETLLVDRIVVNTWRLRRIGVHTEKVRGLRDESDEFIRLMDAIAGLIRENEEGIEYAKKLYKKGLENKTLTTV